MRVLVTGNAGSGKSTLCAWLGERLELPVFGLDQVVWQEGWVPTPKERRAELEQELLGRPEWIIDGVSSRVARAADLVVFLDVPRPVCLYRAVLRNLPYLFRSRPGLPPNCPEWRILPRLIQIIWQFPGRVRPKIMRRLSEGQGLHIRFPEDPQATLESRLSQLQSR